MPRLLNSIALLRLNPERRDQNPRDKGDQDGGAPDVHAKKVGGGVARVNCSAHIALVCFLTSHRRALRTSPRRSRGRAAGWPGQALNRRPTTRRIVPLQNDFL
jgi:hypothetical protein